MRYSPYVTYGHQGLVLGQHPPQPLSGNSFTFRSSISLQGTLYYSAKDYTQSILALKGIIVFFNTRHLLWRLRSSNGSGKLFRYRLRSGENWGLRLPAGVCHLIPVLSVLPSESCSVHQLSLFRSQPWQLCRQAWALGGFLKLGKMLFNSTPFYHRYHKNCDFITGAIRIKRKILFNHGTFCSVKTILLIQIFLLSGYFWLGPHGESALLPVSRSGRGGDSTCRGLDKILTKL